MSAAPRAPLPPLPPPAPRRRGAPRWIERLLPALFVLGGLALLLRREWLTGSGALLLAPAAWEGARARGADDGPPAAPAPGSLWAAVAALVGLVLFVVGWLTE